MEEVVPAEVDGGPTDGRRQGQDRQESRGGDPEAFDPTVVDEEDGVGDEQVRREVEQPAHGRPGRDEENEEWDQVIANGAERPAQPFADLVDPPRNRDRKRTGGGRESAHSACAERIERHRSRRRRSAG